MAIGAGRSDVLRMVLRQGMGLALAGLGVGLLASAGVPARVAAIFPGGPGGDGRTDFVAFLLVAATVLAVTLLAAYLPARRASRINPTEALRYRVAAPVIAAARPSSFSTTVNGSAAGWQSPPRAGAPRESASRQR